MVFDKKLATKKTVIKSVFKRQLSTKRHLSLFMIENSVSFVFTALPTNIDNNLKLSTRNQNCMLFSPKI